MIVYICGWQRTRKLMTELLRALESYPASGGTVKSVFADGFFAGKIPRKVKVFQRIFLLESIVRLN